MTYLITGGAGFIGSNAVDYFIQKGESVIVLDNLLTGFESNIKGHFDNASFKYYKGDIRDSSIINKIFYENIIDVCINFAALISVPESIEKPILTEDININGLINLLKICGENRIKCFVHASSAAIYGDNPILPKVENMIPEPRSPYAISKIAGEYYNNCFSHIYKYKALNFRFFNVFGPRQNPKSAYAAAVPIFIKKIIDGENIVIYGDGEQTRDFVFVKDLLSAIDFMINKSLNNGELKQVYNLGYGNSMSINSLVKTIKFILKSDILEDFEEIRDGDIRHSYASIDNILNEGWKPIYGFKYGLNETISSFRKK